MRPKRTKAQRLKERNRQRERRRLGQEYLRALSPESQQALRMLEDPANYI